MIRQTSLRVSVVGLLLVLMGCNEPGLSVDCAAPDRLCAPSQDESRTPCEPGEVGCTVMEFEHCDEPWIRYCRDVPVADVGLTDGGGDSGPDAGPDDAGERLPLCTMADGPCDVPRSDDGCPEFIPDEGSPCEVETMECAYCPRATFGVSDAETRTCTDGAWASSGLGCAG